MFREPRQQHRGRFPSEAGHLKYKGLLKYKVVSPPHVCFLWVLLRSSTELDVVHRVKRNCSEDGATQEVSGGDLFAARG